MRIPTFNAEGKSNGWLLPIWNNRQAEWRPDQVYLTVVFSKQYKGPHLHKRRTGRFRCIEGDARVVMRLTTGNLVALDPSDDIVIVPPGVPAAIYNLGNSPAYILNLPSPSWAVEDQDEWPVDDWKHPEWWIENADRNCQLPECG